MKIDGRDSLVINRIQNQVRNTEVQKMGDIDSTEKVSDERKYIESEDKGRPRPYSQQLEEAVRLGNEALEGLNLGVQFRLHESSGQYQVQVVDRKDGRVIKEIPSEKMLKLAGQIKEMVGLLLDEKR